MAETPEQIREGYERMMAEGQPPGPPDSPRCDCGAASYDGPHRPGCQWKVRSLQINEMVKLIEALMPSHQEIRTAAIQIVKRGASDEVQESSSHY
jgi:hypothetical protein